MLSFLFATVLVGLMDGRQVRIDNPRFEGFIQSREDSPVVLIYRQDSVRGEIPIDSVVRIDLGYKKGDPFRSL
jgi:hypothetical protein